MTLLRARAALSILVTASLLAPHAAWAATAQGRPASPRVDLKVGALRTAQAATFNPAGPAAAVSAHPILKVVEGLPAAVLAPDLATAKGVRELETAVLAMPEGAARDSLMAVTKAASTALAGGAGDGLGKAYENAPADPQPAPAAAAAPTLVQRLAAASWMPKAIAARLAPAPKTAAAQAVDPKTLEVPIDKLRWTPSRELLPAAGTREIMPSEQHIVGQDRALRAIHFGLKMPGTQYNLYVSGPQGSGRETAVRHLAGQLAATMPTPGDIVAATNFENPKDPVMLTLPAGSGARFQDAVKKFLGAYQKALPQMMASPQMIAARKGIQAEIDQNARRRRAELDAEIAAVRVNGKFGIRIVPQKTEGGMAFAIAVTYDAGGTMVTVGSPNDLDAQIALGAFTRAEWEQANAEAEQAAAPFIERYEALFAQNAHEAEAATLQLDHISRQMAMRLVGQLGGIVMASVGPDPHDTPEHRAFDARAEARQKAFMEEMLKERLGVYGIIVQPQGNGQIAMTLTKDQGGKMVPMTPEEIQAVIQSGQVTQQAIQQAVMALVKKYQEMQELNRREHEEVHKNDPEPTAEELAGRQYAQRLLEHVAMNYAAFLPPGMAPEGPNAMPFRLPPGELVRVSVVVDNTGLKGAPVVVDDHPSLDSSFGKAEDHSKRVKLPGEERPVMIESPGGPTLKGGLFHKANGGFYVVDVIKALRAPGYWEALMKAVSTGDAEIVEGGLEGLMMGRLSTKYKVGSRPKVVLIGSPTLKHLLAQHEDAFRTYFNASAQFEHWLPISAESVAGYLQFMKSVIRKSVDLNDFSVDGIAAVLEEAARFADSNIKLTSSFGAVYDLMRRATFWAREAGAKEVKAEHVAKAIRAEREAGDAAERYMVEHFAIGSSKIAVSGMAKEQINGLVVTGMGFGLPQRVVAQYLPGPKPFEVVWADQAARWTGPMANKSASDVEARLQGLLGSETPLTGTLKISFTQMSGGIDGDSATSTMIYAGLAAIAGVELNQGFAVTGSADPHGVIQPIGGANEKTEGFFNVAQRLFERMFKKDEDKPVTGVIVPDSNVNNLQLSPEVVSAARDGRFKVYQVSSDREAMELLTAQKVGERGLPFDVIVEKAKQRLKDLREKAAPKKR